MNESDIKDIIAGRAYGRIKPLIGVPELQGLTFWVAGGALIREGNDVDLFCSEKWPDSVFGMPHESFTKNAVTMKIGDGLFQFCTYRKPTLGEMVRAFDFAHCQIGCQVSIEGGVATVSDVQWTEAFALSRCAETSWFVGSEYPLSSMIRVSKYFKNGMLTRGAAIRASIDTLTAVVTRGFSSYEDFKDQLDAVDLGLVPEELKDVDRASLVKLFDSLHRPR